MNKGTAESDDLGGAFLYPPNLKAYGRDVVGHPRHVGDHCSQDQALCNLSSPRAGHTLDVAYGVHIRADPP